DHLKAVELAALPRILRVARLREPAARERIRIQDDQRAALEQRQVDLQRRGIERDEHLRRVAGSRDRPRAEMDLVSGYAERRAGRRADLGRIIRKRAEILARESRGADELRAHQLNAVAGITGKAHDDGFGFLVVEMDHLQSPLVKSTVRRSSVPSTSPPLCNKLRAAFIAWAWIHRRITRRSAPRTIERRAGRRALCADAFEIGRA